MVRNACALLLYLLPYILITFLQYLSQVLFVTWLWTRTLATDTVKSLLAYHNNKYKYLHHITSQKKVILSYNINQYFEQTEMQHLSYINKTII